MDYNFQIGKGIAGINFDYTVDRVIQTLGKPDKRQEDSVSLYLQYERFGLFLSYEKQKQKQKYIDLSIETDILLYEGKNWYNYNKTKLLKIIQKIYKKKNYIFDYNLTKIDTIKECQYNFFEIGVTLFFQKNKLKSIDVSKPII